MLRCEIITSRKIHDAVTTELSNYIIEFGEKLVSLSGAILAAFASRMRPAIRSRDDCTRRVDHTRAIKAFALQMGRIGELDQDAENDVERSDDNIVVGDVEDHLADHRQDRARREDVQR